MKSTQRPPALARALALLLLGFIVYGTTVEAAHTHAGISTAKNLAGSVSVADPAKEAKSSTRVVGCGDCLICQLHQNFSATLISVPPTIGHVAHGARTFNSTTFSVHSYSTAPQTGRAPPQANL